MNVIDTQTNKVVGVLSNSFKLITTNDPELAQIMTHIAPGIVEFSSGKEEGMVRADRVETKPLSLANVMSFLLRAGYRIEQ